MNRPQSKLMAAAWMAGWLVLMLIVAIGGRETLRELNVFQVMELRSVIGFVLLVPLVYGGGLTALATKRPLTYVVRNIVHYGAQLGWFFALTLIPIGQVVSIEFTMPIWIAIFAATFLGERLSAGRIAAIVLGLIGVVVIVRPATSSVDLGQLIALAAAFGFGVSVTLMKSLTRTETTIGIIFWMLVIQSVLGLAPALWFWQWPSSYAWIWILVVAFGGTFSHYCMARALTYADATVVIPMDFLRVPLSATAGWLLYGEQLDAYTVLGAALILTGNLLNLRKLPSAPQPQDA